MYNTLNNTKIRRIFDDLSHQPQKDSPELYSQAQNIKAAYYMRCALRSLTPAFLLRHRAEQMIVSLDSRSDREEILERVSYYNRLSAAAPISQKCTVGDIPNGKSSYDVTFSNTREFSISRSLSIPALVTTSSLHRRPRS